MDKTEYLLSLLLSAVSNEQGRGCNTDPCALCSVAEEAQAHLNDLYPDRTTGWWWEEDDEKVINGLEEL